MLGSGRPFLLEIQNARYIPSEESVNFLETKINNLEKKLVSSLPNQHCCFSCHWAITKEHIMDAGRCEKSETGGQSVVGTDAWRRSRETGLFFFLLFLIFSLFPYPSSHLMLMACYIVLYLHAEAIHCTSVDFSSSQGWRLAVYIFTWRHGELSLSLIIVFYLFIVNSKAWHNMMHGKDFI